MAVLVSVLPLSSVSVAPPVPAVLLLKTPTPVRLMAPLPPSVAEAPSLKLTFSAPMLSGPALLSVPPLMFTLPKLEPALDNRFSVPPLMLSALGVQVEAPFTFTVAPARFNTPLPVKTPLTWLAAPLSVTVALLAM